MSQIDCLEIYMKYEKYFKNEKINNSYVQIEINKPKLINYFEELPNFYSINTINENNINTIISSLNKTLPKINKIIQDTYGFSYNYDNLKDEELELDYILDINNPPLCRLKQLFLNLHYLNRLIENKLIDLNNTNFFKSLFDWYNHNLKRNLEYAYYENLFTIQCIGNKFYEIKESILINNEIIELLQELNKNNTIYENKVQLIKKINRLSNHLFRRCELIDFIRNRK